jgi:hypothetical protein
MHQHHNDHHWQHWILTSDKGSQRALPMPEEVVREMVADWIGAGKAISGKQASVKDWYKSQKDNIVLHANTRKLVESLVEKSS